MKQINGKYDVIVIGGGLGGLSAANRLQKCGHQVLLLEQHSKLGGLATWFHRKNDHIFDVSLHGFPSGMIKTCRKYWSKEIAQSIVQLKGIRFDNPQFSFSSTYDRQDFTRLLTEFFKIPQSKVDGFFDTARNMNFYDDQSMTTQELFDKFFPGNDEVVRLLMESIAYANGSTLDDPAICYGIVFSNFMNKGVYTFKGGSDRLISTMKSELESSGVCIQTDSLVEKVLVANGRVCGIVANGREFKCKAVVSNGNIMSTIHELVGDEHFSESYLSQVRKMRLSNSSCQVYIGLKEGTSCDYIGDLLFVSTADKFDSRMLCSKDITSRTFSIYYPDLRPGDDRCRIVSSTNANYEDWAHLSKEEYERGKSQLINDTVECLEKYIPGVREKIDYCEAATPKTFARYTRHMHGASFGTKFEGLKISMELTNEIKGLHHTGSVGIIMSGWLGAINYGVIVANNVDREIANVHV
ncbi:MAG: phytoene desaturase family protein [bacterium]